jgi:hypothetical protein
VASKEAARSYRSSETVSGHAYRFLSPHQGGVLDAAAGRLMPGPDLPEARVVTFVDRLLSQFDVPPGDLRVADLRDHYTTGIAMLDEQADGDFTAVSLLRQDLILSQIQLAPFVSLLFDHIIKALYAAPEHAARCVGSRHFHGCDDSPSEIAMA